MDSEVLKLNDFWIFTKISKHEQLYLLFNWIEICVFMLVWKSSGCSLRKYIVLCTHIIVMNYRMLFLLKNWEKLTKIYFFHLISFSEPSYCTKALLICLGSGFSNSIPSMFIVSRSRDVRTIPFWSYEDLNFEKFSGTPQFYHFFNIYFKWNIFSHSKSSANNSGWSWHTFWWTSWKIGAGSF